MKKSLQLFTIIFLILTITLIGCTSIETKMSRKKVDLNYIFDSEIKNPTLDINAGFTVDLINGLPEAVTSSNETFILIPLIVFTYMRTSDTMFVGNVNLKPGLKQFLYNSFITEAGRSGQFQISESKDVNYEIKYSVDSCSSYCILNQFGLQILTAGSSTQKFLPGSGFLKTTVQVLKNNESVFKKIYNTQGNSPFAKGFYSSNDNDAFYRAGVANMVESLSFAIKSNIELAITDLNKFFKDETEKK